MEDVGQIEEGEDVQIRADHALAEVAAGVGDAAAEGRVGRGRCGPGYAKHCRDNGNTAAPMAVASPGASAGSSLAMGRGFE